MNVRRAVPARRGRWDPGCRDTRPTEHKLATSRHAEDVAHTERLEGEWAGVTIDCLEPEGSVPLGPARASLRIAVSLPCGDHDASIPFGGRATPLMLNLPAASGEA